MIKCSLESTSSFLFFFSFFYSFHFNKKAIEPSSKRIRKARLHERRFDLCAALNGTQHLVKWQCAPKYLTFKCLGVTRIENWTCLFFRRKKIMDPLSDWSLTWLYFTVKFYTLGNVFYSLPRTQDQWQFKMKRSPISLTLNIFDLILSI